MHVYDTWVYVNRLCRFENTASCSFTSGKTWQMPSSSHSLRHWCSCLQRIEALEQFRLSIFDTVNNIPAKMVNIRSGKRVKMLINLTMILTVRDRTFYWASIVTALMLCMFLFARNGTNIWAFEFKSLDYVIFRSFANSGYKRTWFAAEMHPWLTHMFVFVADL